MNKYIKADTVLKFINGCLEHEDKITDTEKSVLTGVKTCIERIPFADVVEVRRGRWGNKWICSNMTGYEYACSCSECNKPTYRISTLEPMPPYCPNCGAKMDGGPEDE